MAVLRVSVQADGTIVADGRPCDLGALDPLLIRIKEQGGQVWYHREAAAGEPPPQAMEVIKRLVHFKIPVSMSSKPDFSDYVDVKGVSRRRSAAPQLTTNLVSRLETLRYALQRTDVIVGRGERVVRWRHGFHRVLGAAWREGAAKAKESEPTI